MILAGPRVFRHTSNGSGNWGLCFIVLCTTRFARGSVMKSPQDDPVIFPGGKIVIWATVTTSIQTLCRSGAWKKPGVKLPLDECIVLLPLLAALKYQPVFN